MGWGEIFFILVIKKENMCSRSEKKMFGIWRRTYIFISYCHFQPLKIAPVVDNKVLIVRMAPQSIRIATHIAIFVLIRYAIDIHRHIC